MTVAINLMGLKFGRLTVIKDAGSDGRRRMWLCSCECGIVKTYQGQRLRVGKTTSCGCFQRESTAQRRLKHGATTVANRWPEWGIWRAMINRCYRPQTKGYERYGARGITVCDRWRFGEDGKTGFECFIVDMGRRPSPELSIDRKDNDGPYTKLNCRWVTSLEQAQNRRSRKGVPLPRKQKRKAA